MVDLHEHVWPHTDFENTRFISWQIAQGREDRSGFGHAISKLIRKIGSWIRSSTHSMDIEKRRLLRAKSVPQRIVHSGLQQFIRPHILVSEGDEKWSNSPVTLLALTYCGPVTPYGIIDLGQHWLRYCNCLLLDGTKPLPEPMLTHHQ